jgi:hypothetical protein
VTCDPEREDVDGENACAAHEICLPEGLCADEMSARSSCRRECKRDSQCRDNYVCKEVGTDGVYLAPSAEDRTLGGGTSICVFDG